MNHRAAALVLCCALAFISIPSLGDSPHLLPGDTLTYDITVQVSERSVAPHQAQQLAPRPRDDQSAGVGTATLQILSVDGDGTATGNLIVQMAGFSRGQPVVLQRNVSAKVTPSGEIHPSSPIDPLLDQAIVLADQSMRDLAGRDVHARPNWQWRLPAASYPMTLSFDRALRGEQSFQGLPTLIVQTVGGGDYASDSDPVQASVNMSGTYYYDQRDGLFVGQAVRSDTSVSDASSGGSQAALALVTIVLRSFARAPQAGASPSPSPSASATAAPTPEPTAVPTELSPVPLPTVTLPAPLPTVTPRSQ